MHTRFYAIRNNRGDTVTCRRREIDAIDTAQHLADRAWNTGQAFDVVAKSADNRDLFTVSTVSA